MMGMPSSRTPAKSSCYSDQSNLDRAVRSRSRFSFCRSPPCEDSACATPFERISLNGTAAGSLDMESTKVGHAPGTASLYKQASLKLVFVICTGGVDGHVCVGWTENTLSGGRLAPSGVVTNIARLTHELKSFAEGLKADMGAPVKTIETVCEDVG
ncbi:uncharacterized protein MYCGRDRAFT_97722 [Zymoseptoria tritici IPO323]|uniref:Uncharacterized protein n=1 Tax=Zymoseptoria tritici (strain CBS 115943 / IPO323) TaxID=336722 RepID=F9XR62_ZYMTI|nr:uncharacterized protein MYCGRDRAFT_97722 [Zymoseptoria tritici IPO323]EGP82266.1 hypothetical protein MYCGRDRAFT_97722 [Zymoseptoria tritici IPO323]